jgi:hypothetical protein
MKDLQKRQQTLINLITRVGGRQNIQKWMDEILKIDIKLETKAMFKINVSELHTSIQKRLAEELNGTLDNSGLVDVILTSTNPDEINWYELEIAIYGEIDSDCDRLYECVSWEAEETINDYSQIEKWEIPVPTQEEYQEMLTDKTFLNGKVYKAYIESSTEWRMVEFVPAHWEHKEQWSHSRESRDGYRSGGRSTVSRWTEEIPDTWIWESPMGTRRETRTDAHPSVTIGKYTYQWYVEYAKNEYMDGYFARKKRFEKATELGMTVAELDAKEAAERAAKQIEQEKEDAAWKAACEAEEAAKLAEIPEPEWIRKEIYEKNLNRFWIGDDYVFSYCWDTTLGIVWEHCDDRTKGMAGRVKTSSNLGSSRDVVMARIDSLLEQRSRKSAQERAKEEGYEAYKKAQQSNKRPVKSFEKWLQTVA